MAEFTEFNASIGLAGPTSTRRATAEDFGGTAKGLIQGGKDLQQLGKVLEAHRIKRENADINQSNIDNQGYGADLFRQAEENTDANATNFTTGVLAEYDKNMEVQLANAPNDRVRAEMKANFTRTRNTLVEKSTIFESVTRGKNEVNVFAANGDTTDNIMFRNPTEQQYLDLLDARTKELNNMSAADHIKEALLRDEVKSLRFQQISGLLDGAVTFDQVDEILDQRPEDELSTEAFTQLGKAGLAKQRRFKTDARRLLAEHKQAIRDAQAVIRVANDQLSEGRIPDAATLAHTESVVGRVNDPVTSEMWFNVKTVGKAVHGWMQLPSEDLEAIIVGLEQDTVTDGSTRLEGALLDSARSVLSRLRTGEARDQAEIDTSVSDLFDSMDKRLADGVDMSRDPAFVALVAELPGASPRLQQQVREAIAANATVAGLMDMPIADLVDLFNDLDANRSLSDIKIVELKLAEGVLADMVRVTDINYLDWIQRADPAVFPPLDENSPASMRTRENLMLHGATKYGKEPQFHTTSELKAIGDRLPEMKSEEQMAFIHGYTANMSRETALIALTELAAVNPMFAFVGAGIAHDPVYAIVGTRILLGKQRMDNEGPGRILTATGTPKSDQELIISAALASALQNESLPPTYKAAAQSAAMALLAEGTVKDAIVALNKVLGGTDDGLGGVQVWNNKSFVAPVGVTGDMMGDVFEDNPDSLTELSVDGFRPSTATGRVLNGEELHDAGTFEYIGPDLYVVRMESDKLLLQGAPGEPYTLHITSERLRALEIKE
jgi:hypothetical protein